MPRMLVVEDDTGTRELLAFTTRPERARRSPGGCGATAHGSTPAPSTCACGIPDKKTTSHRHETVTRPA